jgi:hypothetical protein
MISYRSYRPVLALILVAMTVTFVAASDSLADDCLNCSTDPPPPLNASCPALDDAHPDPLLGVNNRAESTAKVGKIADAFSVSSTGEASYRLALEAPPGRLGMEPHPSLVYDSASGSGLVGMGFSLGGFSSITRCGSNVAQDGLLRGVSYDKGDNFCLDGLRLVKVGHIEAAATAQCFDEYRTFPDTFSKILAYCPARGDESKSPPRFQVFTKPGRILDYGNDSPGTPNGRLMGKDGLIRAWWITQESDRRSNAIQYFYRNDTDPVDGHTVTHVPQRINYTSYLGSPARAATNAVVFDTPDVDIDLNAFVGGMEVSRRPRLDKIRMLGLNDAPVRSYRIVWDDNALPGRSRISQVIECAEDNSAKCRPPTRMEWLDQPGKGFNGAIDTGIEYSQGPDADYRFKWMMSDVTGDGLSDLVSTRTNPSDSDSIEWRVARNLGGTLAQPTTWQTTKPPYLPPPENNIWGLTESDVTFDVVPHDYDQDGVTDLLFSDAAGGGIGWLRSPGQGDGFTSKATGIFVPAPSTNHITSSAPLYADIDGDGVADLIQCYDVPSAPGALALGDWEVRRWSPGGNGVPAGFGAPEEVGGLLKRGCYLRSFIHLVDLDGDGKTELVFPPFGYIKGEGIVPPGQAQTAPQCNGACTYQSVQWYQPQGGGASQWTLTDTGLAAPDWSLLGGSVRTLFLDVNGDGLPDAVSGGNSLFPVKLFINEGPRDLLHTVTNGMNPLDPGDSGFMPDVAIEYGTLLDHAKTAGIDAASSEAESETYLPRTDSLNGCAYPRTCVVGSKRVVSSYTLNNGQNQARTFSVGCRHRFASVSAAEFC